jgi:hypothetical protein
MMFTTRRLLSLTLITLALGSVTACKKKDGGAEAAGKPTEAAEGAPAADKPAGPLVMTAQALFDDFTKPGQNGMDLLDKYRPGVTVSGAVTNTIGEESGALHVWLDGANNHKVTLDFTDNGAAAKQKAVKAGDQLSATCQVGGSDDKMMMLTDCVLK